MVLKSISPKELKSKTIAILIKLLATRIVANSFFGFSNNNLTRWRFLLSFSSSKSVGVNENKATSAPEMSAEQANKTRTNTPVVM